MTLPMHNSSVKWGHLGNFDPTPTNTIFFTNPMGSFFIGFIFHNYYNLNCELIL